jgi:hypothetical protein
MPPKTFSAMPLAAEYASEDEAGSWRTRTELDDDVEDQEDDLRSGARKRTKTPTTFLSR